MTGSASMHVRNLLSVVFVLALSGCGGGGGSDGSSTPAAPEGPSMPATLAVTDSSVLQNQEGVSPGESFYFVFNREIGPELKTPELVQLTGGTTTVEATFSSFGRNLTIAPTSALKLRTDYKLTLKAGFAGVSSVLASDYTLSFRTDATGFQIKQIVPANPSINNGGQPLVAAGDLNGDGRQDVVELANIRITELTIPPTFGYTLNLYTQNRQGGFDKAQQIDFVAGQSPSALYVQRVVVLDIDGDGIPEILVPEYSNTEATSTGLRIFGRGNDGKFQVSGFVPSAYLQFLYVGDVDGDGRPDLVGGATGNYAAGFQVFLNEGSKSGAAPTGLFPMPVVSAPQGLSELLATSLNHDGSRQILVKQSGGATPGQPLVTRVMAYSQGSRGVFVPDTEMSHLFDNICDVGTSFCSEMSVVDVDGDGLPDIVFGAVGASSAAYLRRGDTFAKGFEAAVGGYVYVTDANRDGLDDLMIVSKGGSPFIAVALGNRSTNFVYSRKYSISLFNDIATPSAAAIADFNGDGVPDIVVDQVNSGIYVAIQLR